MSKYALAKDLLAQSSSLADGADLDSVDVLEALVVMGIQNLIQARDGNYVRSFLEYELDNIRADGVFEIQKR
ncbi:MAG: hypothetical protein ACR2PZ_27745 [Pseudomonadales bacterium]